MAQEVPGAMGGSSSRHDEPPLELPQQQVVALGGPLPFGGPRGPITGGPAAAALAATPAQHEAVEQVKNPLVWDKHSFHVARSSASKHIWEFTAQFSAEVPCQLGVHFHCLEQAGSHLLQYTPADGHAPPSRSMEFQPGKHTVSLTGEEAIDLKKYPLEVVWKYKKRHADVIPMVLSLFGDKVQSVVHLHLEQPKTRSSGASELHVTMLKQKVFVGGREYTLQDVYGLGDIGKQDAHDESAVGEPCVICLTDPRNTAVLPCHHMCVCEDCARQLQVGAATRNDHCPICRGNITGMQVFDVKK